jgi:hypothetical protein
MDSKNNNLHAVQSNVYNARQIKVKVYSGGQVINSPLPTVKSSVRKADGHYARLLFYAKLAQSRQSLEVPGYSLKSSRPYERLSVKLFAAELQSELQKASDSPSRLPSSIKIHGYQDNNSLAHMIRNSLTSMKVKKLKLKHKLRQKTAEF